MQNEELSKFYEKNPNLLLEKNKKRDRNLLKNIILKKMT